MKRHFISTMKIIRINLNTLLSFEIFYRLLGLFFIFPLVNYLVLLSIRLSGSQYITNYELFEYLFKPTTILIFIVIFFVFAVYVCYEIVALSILFHTSNYNQKIGLQTLIIASVKKFKKVIRKYHVVILLSSMIFFLLVEGLHIAGIASTFELPTIVIQELSDHQIYITFLLISAVVLIILFVETIFFELQCTVELPLIKDNFNHSKEILTKKRQYVIIEFLLLNGFLNGIFYLIYILLLTTLSLTFSLFYFDNTSFGFILTFFYTIYLFVGYLATIILIPINFAWINVWYYENKKTPQSDIQTTIRKIRRNRPFRQTTFKKIYVVIIVLMSIISTVIITNSTYSIDQFSVFKNPKVISHRGAGDFSPENTLSSIEMGIDMGADAIEIDVRFSSDGVPVLMHDTTVTRTTNVTRYTRINQLTLEEIKELDAGSWYSDLYVEEKVPTLEEALDLVNRRANIYIDLKADYKNSEEILIDIIQRTNMENHVKILSFKQNLLEKIKTIEPSIETMLLLSGFVGDIETFIEYDYIDGYGFKNSFLQLNSDIVYMLQAAGKEVYVWTINDAELIQTMANIGVDGIVTDSPILAREIVYSDNTNDIYENIIRRLFKRNRIQQ